jgi:hypothetical protein
VPEKSVKPARKRASSPKAIANREPKVEQDEIAKRAYFIYLQEPHSDEIANWLRAERELTAA